MKNQSAPKAPKVSRKEPKAIAALSKGAPKGKKATALDPAVKSLLKPRIKATTPKMAPKASVATVAEVPQLAAIDNALASSVTPVTTKLSELTSSPVLSMSTAQVDIAPVQPTVKMIPKEVKIEQIPTYSSVKEEEKVRPSFKYASSSSKEGVIKRFFNTIINFLGK